MFSLTTKLRLAKGILTRKNPLYVQFYVTARCNLTCEQCNIIYANSDVRECSTDEVWRIAENLSRIGVGIVLLTGGEPFVRRDLPEIVKAFSENEIHVRMQTNGLASEEALMQCVENGGKDISISLDSLRGQVQDEINGSFRGSWQRAINSIAMVTRCLPADKCFASLGCVLSPRNLGEVEDVVRFGTAIGWYTSLVPIHVTEPVRPMNFRTTDPSVDFLAEHFEDVDRVLDRLYSMKEDGFLLYDSHQYYRDVKRFVRKEAVEWRARNGGVCDSPALYFAILPNGNLAVCCDHRLPGKALQVQDRSFPVEFQERSFRRRVHDVASGCAGCMFGSFPEMTIIARYWETTFERMRVFLAAGPKRNWPYSVAELEEIAREIVEARVGQGSEAGVASASPIPRA